MTPPRHEPHAHTDPAARVYDRTAAVYDLFSAPMEWMGGARRRRRVLAAASGRVLELGIGTGRNLEHYQPGVRLVGVDLSAGMLARTRGRTATSPVKFALVRGDAQRLPFPAASFDTVTATCVFCSVADPVAGLREAARVVRPDGRVLLLEHVRPRGRVAGRLADLLSPLTRRLIGPEINRPTERYVADAGLHIVDIRRDGVWREITATRDADPPGATTGR